MELLLRCVANLYMVIILCDKYHHNMGNPTVLYVNNYAGLLTVKYCFSPPVNSLSRLMLPTRLISQCHGIAAGSDNIRHMK